MATGKTQILFSGTGTTNSYEYRKVNVLGYAKTTFLVEAVNETMLSGNQVGSGIIYTVIGYPVIGFKGYSLTSGRLSSGAVAIATLTDAYEEAAVGVKSYASNNSGAATVLVAGKRR